MLLDTQYNNNGGDNTIINNFTNVSGEKGLGELHNYSSVVVDINSCNNNKPSELIRSKMKNVIIKEIYNILNEVTEKLEDMREQS